MILGFKYKAGPERCYSYRFRSMPTSPFLPEKFVTEIDTTNENSPIHKIKEIHFPTDKILAFYDTTETINGYHREVEFYSPLKSYYDDPAHQPETKFGTHLVRTSKNEPTCGRITT